MAITFDGPSKRIILSSGTVSLGVRDLWSRWADWQALSDNSKFLPAMTNVGGNDIDAGAGTKIPIYAFLLNGWRIRPQEASHTLNVSDGVLLVDGGGDPFVNTLGSYVVRVNYQQPVQAISFSTDGGGGGSLTAAQVWEHIIEGALSAEDIVRVLLGVMAGRVTGAGTGVERFRDQANTKDRVVSTVDVDGNRTSVVLDAT